MARLSKEEILAKAKGILGDNTGDEVLEFLEDIADSVGAEEVEIEGENWEIKYREDMERWEQEKRDLDESWRKKYRDRFFGADEEETEVETNEEEVEEKEISIDDLFN